MTNTCLAEGSDDEEEMIRGVNNGLLLRVLAAVLAVCSSHLRLRKAF